MRTTLGGRMPDWIIPPGDYRFRIVDAKEGEWKGQIRYETPLVVVGTDQDGKEVRYHSLFLKPKGDKGHGIFKHFLKVIGQPYEGEIDIIPENWIGKEFFAKLSHKMYQKEDNKGNMRDRTSMRISHYEPVPSGDVLVDYKDTDPYGQVPEFGDA